MSRRRSLEVIEQAEFVTISELVRLSGNRYSTLKYYSEEGILPFEQEESRLTRRYHRESALQRLKEIQEYKEEGLSIQEIKTRLLDKQE
ncbi:helix-turn-helix domain-containing protein [Paenactinomyces guangxiensis]|uniref:MerR family transcriptional regulator n=1 Tax=Paenactinomyces guangxiensis TaxID=1490290 RepID=A0A7W2A872_9BACL|nr:helix-turn-helix domain-containing protein [Paenactinomyces guangxiensis]MBA4495301.1 MerR family transcriptional regulator [Paenactinomyces guangxiensis]MBH8592577.1 MerR family transcriptional regulator [Paenactinomyces guangxiensis]